MGEYVEYLLWLLFVVGVVILGLGMLVMVESE